MSARCSFWTCSPLKKVLNKIEDSYQTYINTYKTHTMATCHGGTGQPPEGDPNPQEQDVDVHNEYQEDVDDFETRAISCLECKLNRLTLILYPSALLEPLDEVLQQYTETFCTAQKKTSFVNTLLQDITIQQQ